MSNADFSGLDEFFAYKNQLIDDMLSNKSIVRLLSDDCTHCSHPDDLIYTQVFPHEYMPDTVEHGQTFICCEVDIKGADDKTFLRPIIYIWIFTHKSKVRIPSGGVRMDNLASEIAKTINGSRMYGLGELNLNSVKRFSPITDYQGKVLTFVTKDYNRLSPTGKRVPQNRRA